MNSKSIALAIATFALCASTVVAQTTSTTTATGPNGNTALSRWQIVHSDGSEWTELQPHGHRAWYGRRDSLAHWPARNFQQTSLTVLPPPDRAAAVNPMTAVLLLTSAVTSDR